MNFQNDTRVRRVHPSAYHTGIKNKQKYDEKKSDIDGPSWIMQGVTDTSRIQGVPDGLNLPTGTPRITNIEYDPPPPGGLRDAHKGPQHYLTQHLINKNIMEAAQKVPPLQWPGN